MEGTSLMLCCRPPRDAKTPKSGHSTEEEDIYLCLTPDPEHLNGLICAKTRKSSGFLLHVPVRCATRAKWWINHFVCRFLQTEETTKTCNTNLLFIEIIAYYREIIASFCCVRTKSMGCVGELALFFFVITVHRNSWSSTSQDFVSTV